jgi:hypothetical protein
MVKPEKSVESLKAVLRKIFISCIVSSIVVSAVAKGLKDEQIHGVCNRIIAVVGIH